MIGSTRARKRRSVGVVALSSAAMLALAACAGGTSTETKEKGAADTGQITWWGWTPDETPAQAYIKAFNQKYPNIKVTYKKLTIDGYNAALRPALASSVGPDVFDVAPGAANGPVGIYGVNAVDLAPAVEKALGRVLNVQCKVRCVVEEGSEARADRSRSQGAPHDPVVAKALRIWRARILEPAERAAVEALPTISVATVLDR